ncbi:3-oxoacyl-[acyl-carrier-protein] synthase-3 [Pseudomonas sp. ADAK2 TE3594]
MPHSVYVGAAEYAAGETVNIETAIPNSETCALLRRPENGVANFSHYQESIFDLVVRSVTQSLASAGLTAGDMDAVFLVSNMLDAQNNLDINWLEDLSRRLQLENTPQYQIGLTGCAGFHAALRLGAGLIASGNCSRVLLISFDQAGQKLQRIYGEGTDFTYVTGDAAASCILSSNAQGMEYELMGKVEYTSDTTQISNPSSDQEMRSISSLIKRTYASANLAASSIQHYICNNYTLDITRLFCQLAGVAYSKAVINKLPEHAHCFNSDNIINLKYLSDEKKIAVGDNILLFSTGPFQSGACVIKRVSESQRPCV